MQSNNGQDLLRVREAFKSWGDRSTRIQLFKEILAGVDQPGDDIGWKQMAIFHLRELGGIDAGNVLAEVVRRKSDHTLRVEAAEALETVPSGDSVSALFEMYRSDLIYDQVWAAGSLNRLGASEPCGEMLLRLGEMMNHADGAVRREGVELIAGLRTPDAMPLLAKALRDSSGDVRYKAAESLGKMNFPESIRLLQQALQDPHEPVTYEARRSLDKLQKAANAKE